jgi:hypothetical protein
LDRSYGWTLFDESFERASDRNRVGGLIAAANPADQARGLFRSTLGIKSDYSSEDFLVGEAGRPAVRFENSTIKVFVDLSENAEEADVVQIAVLRGELLISAKFFEDVVHVGQCERGVNLLLSFAVGVEALSFLTNRILLSFGACGKREGLKCSNQDLV